MPKRLASGKSTDYGLGGEIDSFDGQPRISHNGGTNGFTCQNAYYPGLHQDIIVLENSSEQRRAKLQALRPA